MSNSHTLLRVQNFAALSFKVNYTYIIEQFGKTYHDAVAPFLKPMSEKIRTAHEAQARVKAIAKHVKPEKTIKAGLRTVAVFEASKGVLVLIIGIALLTLIHRDAQEVAETIVRYSHLNPDRKFLRRFVEFAGTVSDARLWFMGAIALLYSTIRFTEAYGLWRGRVWAEWFAIISGAVYVPIEIYELARQPSLFKVAVLVLNVLIVGYLIYVRWYANHEKERLNLQTDSM
ncbi:MAG: DUF2127 domain-containing protein [Pyrinomonadaceae bacterium]